MAPTKNPESGQSTLELALCLPVFALLILGSAEIGNLSWASVQVNNAARAGAAYAAQSRANAGSTTNILAAAQNEAPGLTISLNPAPTQICQCSDSSSQDVGCTTTTLTTCPSPNSIQVSVRVNTSATVTPFVHYPGLPAIFTVRAQATVGVAQ